MGQDKDPTNSNTPFEGDFKGSLGGLSRDDLKQGYATLEKPSTEPDCWGFRDGTQREDTKDSHLVTEDSINL